MESLRGCDYNELLCRYLREGRDKALAECEERVQALMEQVKEKDLEKKSLEAKKGVLTKELANAKVSLREGGTDGRTEGGREDH